MSDITVGSVAVDIVPDTRGFAEKLKAKLAGISAEIGLTADTSEVRAQLEELTRPRSATINANADTGAAEAQLDAAARSRSATINADARGLGNLVGGISALPALIGGLGPALIPLTAAATGLFAALTAPAAAVGGGLTIFGLLTGAAIAKTQKVAKEIADLKKRADTLVAPKAAKAAAAQAKALEATLTGPQRAFLAAKEALAGAFDTLVKKDGKALFRPVIVAMQTLGQIMPALSPVIRGVSRALTSILREIGKSAKSGALKDFLDFLGRASGPAIRGFGKVLGNLAVGFGGLAAAFSPAGKSLTTGLIDLTDRFADFGKNADSNKGLQSFVAYVQDVGPKVASTLGHIAGAVVRIGEALAPLGVVVLAAIDGLSKLIIAASPEQLTTVAAALGGVALAIGALGGPVVAIVPAIVAVAAGLIQAYKHSKTFRDIVQSLVGWVRDELFPALKDAANKVLPALRDAFASIKDTIADNKPLFRLLGKILEGVGKVITDVLIPVIADFVKTQLPGMAKAFDIVTTAIRIMMQFWLSAIGFFINGAAKAFGWIPGLGGKLKKAAAAFNQFRDEVNKSLDGIHSVKTIRLKVKTSQIVANPSLAKPRGTNNFAEGAGATGAIINRPTVLLAGEAGREALIPLDRTPGNAPLPRGGGLTGPQFNVEKVVAQDVNDFLRQMQLRSRQAGLGGPPVGPR